MIRRKNFANMNPADIPVDTEYENCNFTQSNPVDSGGGVMVGVRLFPGDDTPRIFRGCNLVNCEPPPGSTLISCNTNIVQNDAVAFEDVTRVDGIEVSRQAFHDHIHYGRWNPDTESYDYNPAPVVTPQDY
jgi:hypothetical protein